MHTEVCIAQQQQCHPCTTHGLRQQRKSIWPVWLWWTWPQRLRLLIHQFFKILYFNSDTLEWLKSPLCNWKRSVYLGGDLSTELSLEAGLPQGSTLGPLLYTINTCDFPEVVHDESCPHSVEGQVIQYRTMCIECGGLCCFADDWTYTGTAETTFELSIKLRQKFHAMSTYLTEICLCIITDKTHFLVMSTRQKTAKKQGMFSNSRYRRGTNRSNSDRDTVRFLNKWKHDF